MDGAPCRHRKIMSSVTGNDERSPFAVRSYRFQWPADLCTSWAFEMETLILGWYVLVETGSVLLLTLFASLQYLGTLVAPMFGVVGDRMGHRNLLCMMRAWYAVLATTMMTLALSGVLQPAHVFVIAACMGMVRPSDLVMRGSLVGATMPQGLQMRPGQNYNKYMSGDLTPFMPEGAEVPPGGFIAMANPLSTGQVTYDDETVASVDQMAKDVAAYIAWASDPKQVQRKQAGLGVMIFLFLFAGITYLSYRRIWKGVAH